MLVLGSMPMVKRLSLTSVLIFGIMLSSASMVSDSLPVCWIDRSPMPSKATSVKPLTFLDSLTTLPDPRIAVKSLAFLDSFVPSLVPEVFVPSDSLVLPGPAHPPNNSSISIRALFTNRNLLICLHPQVQLPDIQSSRAGKDLPISEDQLGARGIICCAKYIIPLQRLLSLRSLMSHPH